MSGSACGFITGKTILLLHHDLCLHNLQDAFRKVACHKSALSVRLGFSSAINEPVLEEKAIPGDGKLG